VNRLDQETAKGRGPTRAVEPFKKKKKKIPDIKRGVEDSTTTRIYSYAVLCLSALAYVFELLKGMIIKFCS
jgi:hypothetical protein